MQISARAFFGGGSLIPFWFCLLDCLSLSLHILQFWDRGEALEADSETLFKE